MIRGLNTSGRRPHSQSGSAAAAAASSSSGGGGGDGQTTAESFEERYYREQRIAQEQAAKSQKLEEELKKARYRAMRMESQVSRQNRGSSAKEPQLATSMSRSGYSVKELKQRERELQDLVKSQREHIEQLKKESLQLRGQRRMRDIGAKPYRRGSSKRRPSKQKQKRQRHLAQSTPAKSTRVPQQQQQQQQQHQPATPNKAALPKDQRQMMEQLYNTLSSHMPDQFGRASGPPREQVNPNLPTYAHSMAHSAPVASAELSQVRRELQDSKARITVLQSHYDQLGVTFRAEKEIQKRALDQCKAFSAKLKESQKESRRLQRRIQELEINGEQVEQLQMIIADLRAEKTQLEQRVALLTSNIFQGDQLEAERMKQIVAEYTGKINQLEADLAASAAENDAMKQRLNDTASKADHDSKSAEQLRKDKLKLERSLESALEKVRKLEDKMQILSKDAGVDAEDLERALDMIIRERENPSGLASGDDGDRQQSKSAAALRRELQEMELKYKNALQDIKTKEDMLKIQQQINRDQKRQFAQAHDRVLAMTKQVNLLKYQVTQGKRDTDTISNMSMFSNNDTEFGRLTGVDNIVAIRIDKARLNAAFPIFASQEEPITFIACEFFDFATDYSGLFGGFEPSYDLTTQYQVSVDSFFVDHLEKGTVYIELYRQVDGTDVEKIAHCHIPLYGLLRSKPAAKVKGTAKLVNPELEPIADDEESKTVQRGAVAGQIEFVISMLRPILSRTNTPAVSPRENLARAAAARTSNNNSGTKPRFNLPPPKFDDVEVKYGDITPAKPKRNDSSDSNAKSPESPAPSDAPSQESDDTFVVQRATNEYDDDDDDNNNDSKEATTKSYAAAVRSPQPPSSKPADGSSRSRRSRVKTKSRKQPDGPDVVRAFIKLQLVSCDLVDRDDVALHGRSEYYGFDEMLERGSLGSQLPEFQLDFGCTEYSVPADESVRLTFLTSGSDSGSGDNSMSEVCYAELPLRLLSSRSEGGPEEVPLKLLSETDEVIGDAAVRFTWVLK